MTDRSGFDAKVRALECGSCGAPVEAGVSGGTVACPYCRAVNVIPHRRSDARGERELSQVEEVARLLRLKSQLDNPLEGHVYDFDRPPMGWEHLPSVSDGNQLRQLWLETKRVAESSESIEAQKRLCWLALRLAPLYRNAGQAREERAVLETALSMLRDGGHRHIIRCRLALEAATHGDLAAATAWLAECDPAQELLLLDSVYRDVIARLRYQRSDYLAVLEAVGARSGDIPIHPQHRMSVDGLRIDVHERLNHHDRADAEFAAAVEAHGREHLVPFLIQMPWAKEVVRRDQERTRLARIRELEEMRANIPSTFFGAMTTPIAMWPFLAMGLYALVSIPRCTFNMDPLAGVNGYLVCPELCEDCTGPFRTVTQWSCSGNECSSDGPQYFCYSPGNGMDRMTDEQLEASMHGLREYEAGLSATGTGYLLLLVLMIPLLFLWTIRRYRKTAHERRQLSTQIAELSRGHPPPESPRSRRDSLRALVGSAVPVALFAFVAIIVTIIDLA